MKMKKLTALLLSASMIATMAVGCGSKEEDKDAAGDVEHWSDGYVNFRSSGQGCRDVVPWSAGYIIFRPVDNVAATSNIGRLVTLILGLVDKVAATSYLGRLVTLFLDPWTTLPRRRTLVGWLR